MVAHELHRASAEVDSPLGPLVVACTDRGLAGLAFGREAAEHRARGHRRRPAGAIRDPAPLRAACRELEEYFAGRRQTFEAPVDWRLCHGFTRRVLQAATTVRYGTVTTYADLAAEAGSPRAARAVGNALGANPLPIVVPCHRVIRGDGSLGGYTSGVPTKAFLLELEGAYSTTGSR